MMAKRTDDGVTIPAERIAQAQKLWPILAMAATTIIAAASAVFSIGWTRGASAWQAEATAIRVEVVRQDGRIVSLEAAVKKQTDTLESIRDRLSGIEGELKRIGK